MRRFDIRKMGLGAVDLTSTKWGIGTKHFEIDEFELDAMEI